MGEGIFPLFSRGASWFKENLPFPQRNLWHGVYQNLGKAQHSAINSLARKEFREMWKWVCIPRQNVAVMCLF